MSMNKKSSFDTYVSFAGSVPVDAVVNSRGTEIAIGGALDSLKLDIDHCVLKKLAAVSARSLVKMDALLAHEEADTNDQEPVDQAG